MIACPAVELAASLLEFNETSVVVAEFSPRVATVLPRLAGAWPQTRFVVIVGPDDLAAARDLVESSGPQLQLLPPRAELVAEVVRRHAHEYRSEAGIIGFSLEEMLQLSAVSPRATLLRVWSGGKLGQLVIERGILVDAQREGRDGVEVAYDLLGWEDASVVSLPAPAARRSSIGLPLTAVVVEAARRRDEYQGPNGPIATTLAQLVRRSGALAAMVIDLDNGRTLAAKGGNAVVPSCLRDAACAAERAVQSLISDGQDPGLHAVEMLSMTLADYELVLAPFSSALAILTVASTDAPLTELRAATLRAARELRSISNPPEPSRARADPFAG